MRVEYVALKNQGKRIRIRGRVTPKDRKGRRIADIRFGSIYWRAKPHPWFYVSNAGTVFTVQIASLEIFYFKNV